MLLARSTIPTRGRMRPLALALVISAGQLHAQVLDEATLVIHRTGREVGREDFTLRRGRAGDSEGTTLASVARYPSGTPSVQLGAVLERTAAGEMAAFKLEVEAAAGVTRVRAQGSRTRVAVQHASRGTEHAHEYPAGAKTVILDDSLFALYTAVSDFASPAGERITAIFPRADRRVSFIARKETPVDSGGVAVSRTQLSGDLSGAIWTDGEGHLMRIELTDTKVTRLRN